MVVLLSTYELGRPAFATASAAAWLRDAGIPVRVVDLSRAALDDALVREASLFAIHVPMHAATRLAGTVLDRLQSVRPDAARVVFGLYAPLNAGWLSARGATHVLGAEAEPDLVHLASGALVASSGGATTAGAPGIRDEAGASHVSARRGVQLPRLAFKVPDRRDEPPLASFARLHVQGEARLAGYTEATRGCLHTCAHCPIVPVYQGALRVVPLDVVLADIDQQVARGARHITFGDPDFFNGPTHARRIVEALARRHPDVSYDVTVKVEHLLAQVDLLDVLAGTGCAFVTSAVEAFDDRILGHLRKGHTADDARRAIEACRARALVVVPTFVAFTPWTTLDGYLAFLEELQALDLADVVAPVQLGLRLLLPDGSPLLQHPDVVRATTVFDADALAWPWTHDDPRVDRLHAHVVAWLSGAGRRASRHAAYAWVRTAAWRAAERGAPSVAPFPPDAVTARATVPYLDEPWYC